MLYNKLNKTFPIETHSTDFYGSKKAVRTDGLVNSVTFPEKASTRFLHRSSSFLLLFVSATPSLLLLSLPPTMLPTHSVGAFGSHFAAPLPFVCWRLMLFTGVFTSASCHSSASRHTSALRRAPLVWLVVAFPRASAAPSNCASARCLGPRHSSHLHLL